jgi:hypothetical protein
VTALPCLIMSGASACERIEVQGAVSASRGGSMSAIADGLSRVTTGATTGVFAMQFGPGAENAFATWRRRVPTRRRSFSYHSGMRSAARE